MNRNICRAGELEAGWLVVSTGDTKDGNITSGSGMGPHRRRRRGAGTARRSLGACSDPLSIGQRVDYAAGSVVARSPYDERERWEARLSGVGRESLKTAVAVWYGASGISRNAFRRRLLDPSTDDDTADRLRDAAKGIVDARTHAQLGAAGADLAAAAQTIGVDRFPRFLGDAERRAVAAMSEHAIPGVVKASAAGTDMAAGAVGLGLVLLMLALKNQGSRPARPSITPSNPTSVPSAYPKDDKAGQLPATSPAGPDNGPSGDVAKPGDATLAEDRRKYILDGNGRGGGGHGPGRTTPDKSTFPSDWSDEKTVEAIKDVANDPVSVREPAKGERTAVRGVRDGVEIEVIIGRDRKAIVTAYPVGSVAEKE